MPRPAAVPSADRPRLSIPDSHLPPPARTLERAKPAPLPNPHERSFLVEGEGEFPLDMLRQERCWPARPQDSRAIAMRPNDSTPSWRQVVLTTTNVRCPRRERWRRKAWRVID